MTVRSALAIALLALGAARAGADPADHRARADALFREGRELFAAGKTTEACDAFARSEVLDPAAATSFALAVCREKSGQLATAWRLFSEVANKLRGATDPTSQQLHTAAVAGVDRLTPRLSKLTVVVPPEREVPGLEILRGAAVMQRKVWNYALPLNGGTVTITARAPGYQPWTATIVLAPEGDAQTVEVPALTAVAAGAPPEPPPAPGAPTVAAPVEPTEPTAAIDVPVRVVHPRSRKLPLALGAGALVLGGAAVGLEIAARDTYARALADDGDTKRLADWSSANHQRYADEALGGAAVACAATAIWLLVRTPPVGDRAPLALAPLVTGDRAGLVLVGRY